MAGHAADSEVPRQRALDKEQALSLRVADLMARMTRMHDVLAALSNKVAVVEEQVADCFEARANASAERSAELLAIADHARQYAVFERAQAARYALPAQQLPEGG